MYNRQKSTAEQGHQCVNIIIGYLWTADYYTDVIVWKRNS